MKFKLNYWEEYWHDAYSEDDLKEIKQKIKDRENTYEVEIEDQDNEDLTRFIVQEHFEIDNPFQAIEYAKEQTNISLSEYWGLYIMQDNGIDLPLATEELF